MTGIVEFRNCRIAELETILEWFGTLTNRNSIRKFENPTIRNSAY